MKVLLLFPEADEVEVGLVISELAILGDVPENLRSIQYLIHDVCLVDRVHHRRRVGETRSFVAH